MKDKVTGKAHDVKDKVDDLHIKDNLKHAAHVA